MNREELTYHFEDKNICEKSFNDFGDAISLFKKIIKGNMMLEKQIAIKIRINET